MLWRLMRAPSTERPGFMRIGLRPDAMEPDIHCVGTHWNRGFMAFQLGLGAATLVTAMG